MSVMLLALSRCHISTSHAPVRTGAIGCGITLSRCITDQLLAPLQQPSICPIGHLLRSPPL